MTHHLRFDVAELGALHVAAWVRAHTPPATGQYVDATVPRSRKGIRRR